MGSHEGAIGELRGRRVSQFWWSDGEGCCEAIDDKYKHSARGHWDGDRTEEIWRGSGLPRAPFQCAMLEVLSTRVFWGEGDHGLGPDVEVAALQGDDDAHAAHAGGDNGWQRGTGTRAAD
jgi:hypothetical protein